MRKRWLAVVTITAATAALAVLAGGSGAKAPRPAHSAANPPNIVFILTDDLSWNLVNDNIAPHLMQLRQQGETFKRYFVADSLCCPSRSTIFTGLFPHDTRVFTNLAPDGGFQRFQAQNLDKRTFAVALQHTGYQTSMMGKYLNGYGDRDLSPTTAPIPPGWTDWHVSNHTGYLEFNYVLNENGTYNAYGSDPAAYGVDVLNDKAQSFIDANASRPFAIEIATFAPHKPYTPAPRNANDFPGMIEPRDPSFNRANINPPAWLAARTKKYGRKKIGDIDTNYRTRAQAVESVDKMVGDLEATLAAEHLADNTYFVFSSDNGYHLGQHLLRMGKQTAFDTDINVPLIVAGPGVPKGRTVNQVVQNTDLYPTFVDLAGATPANPVDGDSIVPLLHPGARTPAWPTAALVEHRSVTPNPNDPDAEGGKGTNFPTSYEAVRLVGARLAGFRRPLNAVYVEYLDAKHELEYYDLDKDPYEIRNVANRLTATQKRSLHRALLGLERCHTASACWKARLPR